MKELAKTKLKNIGSGNTNFHKKWRWDHLQGKGYDFLLDGQSNINATSLIK